MKRGGKHPGNVGLEHHSGRKCNSISSLLLRTIAENGPVHYRLYHPEDFAQFYAIEEICFQPPVRFSRRYLRQIIERGNSVTWVAEQDGSVAGFSAADFTTEFDHTFVYVQTIEVAPAHRNQGIGSELYSCKL